MKRGQVTLFIIIGVALLLGFALFLLLRKPVEVTLPPSLAPVQEHVHNCLRLTTIDALKRLAAHGGYLNPARDAGRELTIDPNNPTESDAILLNPADNESIVPYWYYLAGSNRCAVCLLTTLTPSLETMEQEVRTYLLQHLHECINYGLFPDITITASPEQDATVTFNDGNVLVEYERQLTLQRGDTTRKLKHFTERIDIPFKRYYEVAKQITQREIDTQFLENYLLYLVSAYSGVNASLPPLGGYEEGFTPHVWVLYNVQQRFQQLIQSITPSFQVLGTKGVLPVPHVTDPYVRGFLNTMRLDLLNDSGLRADDLRVTIFAPDQPLYLDVKPRKGQLIKPRSERQGGILFVPPRQQNYYDFFYDLSAPFLVEVRAENATPGTDLSFLFALEANVRDNKNMAEWLLGRGTIPWSRDFVSYKVTDPSSLDPNASQYLNRTKYAHNTSLPTLLCSPEQAVVPLQARTFDARTQRALPGVSFSFTCGEYATCPLATSEMDEHGVYATLETKVPQCVGGLLTAEKEGYNPVTLHVSARRGQPPTIPDILLEPFVTRNITFKKFQLSRGTTGQLSLNGPKPLEVSHETVFATLTRKKSSSTEPSVTVTAIISNTTNLTSVKIVPGLYEVRAYYIDNDGRFIPPGCKHIRGHAIPDQQINITPAPWGGLELARQPWQLERHALYTHNTLVIPVIVLPPPRCIDDLEEMDRIALYSRQYRTRLLPFMS